MNIKMTLYSAEEFTAAAAFCTALAEARRKEDADRSYKLGIDRASNSLWRNVPEGMEENEVTAGEIVDALHGALKAETAAEDADDVEFQAAAAEPPKRRGRPRKEQPVAEEPVVLEGEVLPADSGQIDIEDVIASQIDDTAVHDSSGDVYQDLDVTPPTPQPADPAAGWTIQDARNAGRALLDRAPDVDTGNRKLAATLVPFGVQQVKALQPDQIEAFVVATQKAVF